MVAPRRALYYNSGVQGMLQEPERRAIGWAPLFYIGYPGRGASPAIRSSEVNGEQLAPARCGGMGPGARSPDRLQPALSNQQRHQLRALAAALSGLPEMLAQVQYLPPRPLGV